MASFAPYSWIWHDDFAPEFKELEQSNAEAAALLFTFFQEIKNHPSKCVGMLRRGVTQEENPAWSAEPWIEMRDAGHDVWRIKFPREVSLRDVRVIYCYDQKLRRFAFLGLMQRTDVNYETASNFGLRIIASYCELGLPSFHPRR